MWRGVGEDERMMIGMSRREEQWKEEGKRKGRRGKGRSGRHVRAGGQAVARAGRHIPETAGLDSARRASGTEQNGGDKHGILRSGSLECIQGKAG
jgi:hypothetical protein